jgi:hypothetical protein
MSTPQQIQQEIERTRASLSSDVDRLSEKVSPKRVVERRVDGIKGSARSMKEKVMGVSDSAAQTMSESMHAVGHSVGESAGSAASSVGDTVSDVASNVAQTAQQAPQQIRQQAQGNPLAAGLIAFGVGWLVSSMLPASQAERELASAAQAKASEIAEPAKQVASEVASNLQEPAQHAVEEVRSAATEAASQTAEQAKSAAEDVKSPLTS